MTLAARRTHGGRTDKDLRPVCTESFLEAIFPPHLELLPQVAQRYEFELAYAESKTLTDAELVRRSAYLYRVRGELTHHYRICQHRPVQVDPDLKHRQNFFDANAYGVGYATHGLFPYRGKFHPQMIKGIMNVIGLRQGDTVLDPMAGSGTTLIEASLIGVHSIGVELNPFACLMARAKLAGLQMKCASFPKLVANADALFNHFEADTQSKELLFDVPRAAASSRVAKLLDGDGALRELVLLAFLDTMGYATRRKSKTARELFPIVLTRYLAAVEQFNLIREELELTLGEAQVICEDCRRLNVPDDSIDGVVFSPPYSFAIDYVANDELQLRYLGFDPQQLSARMVGLVGPSARTAAERVRLRVEHYFNDMNQILAECIRVMKRGSCCVIVIGSNTNQTGGIRLETRMIEYANQYGAPLQKHITREIEGIRNTMREEHILVFRKV